MYTINGVGLVVFELSHPKKVGLWFRPRLMKVLLSGIAGKDVPLAIPVLFRLRW